MNKKLFGEQRRQAELISRMNRTNPFLPARIELERSILGAEFDPEHALWNVYSTSDAEYRNLARIKQLVSGVLNQVSGRINPRHKYSAADVELYHELVLFNIYHQYNQRMSAVIAQQDQARKATIDFYGEFEREYAEWIAPFREQGQIAAMAQFYFAGFFQIRRAFHFIFHYIIGRSEPISQLRAKIWESIFTHDLPRYRRALHQRMRDFSCLITGPSGSGKELAAAAVGMSQFIPYQAGNRRFERHFRDCFIPLNLSALSPTLIESELFGHVRGAFTGAVADHTGWLESCPEFGTVFLDEIGDITPEIQVKLLRVLQTRTFNRLGESAERKFAGKIIAATNRNLTDAMRRGQFREDFYYRICSDQIQTPALQDQLANHPQTLPDLLNHISRRLAGAEEAAQLAAEAEQWILKRLGRDYAWPGNVRELEQCVRAILIRGEYHPLRPRPDGDDLLEQFNNLEFTAEELLRRYCAHAWRVTGSYQQAARKLALDQRTLKAKIKPD